MPSASIHKLSRCSCTGPIVSSSSNFHSPGFVIFGGGGRGGVGKQLCAIHWLRCLMLPKRPRRRTDKANQTNDSRTARPRKRLYMAHRRESAGRAFKVYTTRGNNNQSLGRVTKRASFLHSGSKSQHVGTPTPPLDSQAAQGDDCNMPPRPRKSRMDTRGRTTRRDARSMGIDRPS